MKKQKQEIDVLGRNSRSLKFWSCWPWVISGDETAIFLASATPFSFLPQPETPFILLRNMKGTIYDGLRVSHEPLLALAGCMASRRAIKFA